MQILVETHSKTFLEERIFGIELAHIGGHSVEQHCIVELRCHKIAVANADVAVGKLCCIGLGGFLGVFAEPIGGLNIFFGLEMAVADVVVACLVLGHCVGAWRYKQLIISLGGLVVLLHAIESLCLPIACQSTYLLVVCLERNGLIESLDRLGEFQVVEQLKTAEISHALPCRLHLGRFILDFCKRFESRLIVLR